MSQTDLKFERLPNRTRVRTIEPRKQPTDYTPEAMAKRKFGVEGVIVQHSDSHGLCYLVRHDDDGTHAYYEPDEVEAVLKLTLGCIVEDTSGNRHRAYSYTVHCKTPNEKRFALYCEVRGWTTYANEDGSGWTVGPTDPSRLLAVIPVRGIDAACVILDDVEDVPEGQTIPIERTSGGPGSLWAI